MTQLTNFGKAAIQLSGQSTPRCVWGDFTFHGWELQYVACIKLNYIHLSANMGRTYSS